MTESLGAGERRTPSYYTVLNTAAELANTEPSGNLAVTLGDGTEPFVVWGRKGGQWVSLFSVAAADIPAPQPTTVQAAPAATETSPGTVEHATQAEVQAGTAGNVVPTAARLKAELDRRAGVAAGRGFLAPAQRVQLRDGATAIASGEVIVSADLRADPNIPDDAAGVYVHARMGAQASNRTLIFDSADNAIDTGSAITSLGQHLSAVETGTNAPAAAQDVVPFGTGANAGKIKIAASAQGSITNAAVYVVGWWR